LAEDCQRIEAVLRLLAPGQQLAVDANGRFELATALEYGRALAQYPLFWYEEAGDPLDYELQARLAQNYTGSLATGENLFSLQDARNLIRYAGMRPDRDWLQFDCALSYGLVEYLRILEMLREHGWPATRCIPHGGHQMSLAIAAGLGCFSPMAAFPTGYKCAMVMWIYPPCQALALKARRICSRKCALWCSKTKAHAPHLTHYQLHSVPSWRSRFTGR